MSHTCNECLCKDVCSRYPCFYPELCRHSMFNDEVIRLPCKIGDTVYRISKSGNKKWHVLEREVVGIRLFKRYNGSIGFTIVSSKDDTLGETVFLTRVEAEHQVDKLNESIGI